MKVSIAWIFDHINADWRTIDIATLVKKFNQTTAEIENWYPVSIDLRNLFLAQAQSQETCLVSESKKTVSLKKRTDIEKGNWYLVAKEGAGYRWATSCDVGGTKEMLLPSLKHEAWKKDFETNDYILEIDNKSITHRPDLWGHRGFAREVAALLNLPLKPYSSLLARKPIKKFSQKAPGEDGAPAIAIKDPNFCDRFAGLYISEIEYSPSMLWMVSRLSRIDARSLDFLIDCTNYVMFDTSQPMHVFDAEALDQYIEVRQAHDAEKLQLLDGQAITLCKKDSVIADKKGALSLAGIMGGKGSGVTPRTQSVFLEAAHFDAVMIRQSSQRYHVRTESSARFEKSLDPMQNVTALLRYLKLLDGARIAYKASHIASVGKQYTAPSVKVSLSFIERRLGVTLAPSFVKKTLEKIEFKVSEKKSKSNIQYTITVPLFRATKDIAIPIDIVEEVGRFYGYQAIPFVLPEHTTQPVHTAALDHKYAIKHQLAFGLSMREVYGYAFFDESFLQELGWQPSNTIDVENPVSKNWYRLVTTLMPHMFKSVRDNHHQQDELRFFEWARVWHKKQATIVEQKKLVGIFYQKKEKHSFYDYKALLTQLSGTIRLPLAWQQPDRLDPWMENTRTAQLMYNQQSIGFAGFINEKYMKNIAEGSAFVFELDADFLEQYHLPAEKFIPLPKYPSIDRDISIMVSGDSTVEQITKKILQVDSLIVSVDLIDFFQKKEWKNQRALTFRYVMRDAHKTLTHTEADRISAAVANAVVQLGAQVR